MPIHTFGRGEDGQIGDSLRLDSLPTCIPFPLRVRDASCGSGHTLIVDAAGRCFTWGRGDDGRLGHRASPSEGPETGWASAPKEALLLTSPCASPRRVLTAACGS